MWGPWPDFPAPKACWLLQALSFSTPQDGLGAPVTEQTGVGIVLLGLSGTGPHEPCSLPCVSPPSLTVSAAQRRPHRPPRLQPHKVSSKTGHPSKPQHLFRPLPAPQGPSSPPRTEDRALLSWRPREAQGQLGALQHRPPLPRRSPTPRPSPISPLLPHGHTAPLCILCPLLKTLSHRPGTARNPASTQTLGPRVLASSSAQWDALLLQQPQEQ